MNQPVEPTPQAAPRVGAVSALANVLIEPGKTFQGLRDTAPWLLAMVVVSLGILAFSFVNWDHLINAQIENWRTSEIMPEDQRAETLAGLVETRDHPKVHHYLMGPLFSAILSLLGAAIWLLVGNVVLGGDGSFKRIWCIFNYAGMVGIVEMILKTAMMQMKGSADVYTSLALFAGAMDTGGFAFRALNAVDIFSIWFFAVMAIGVSVMCKVHLTKAMRGSFAVWALWAFGWKAGVMSVLGPYMGM